MTKLPRSHIQINYLGTMSGNGPTAETSSVFSCSWRVSRTSATNTSSRLPNLKVSYPTWRWNSVSSQSKKAGAWEKWKFMDLMEWFVPIPWMSFWSCATAITLKKMYSRPSGLHAFPALWILILESSEVLQICCKTWSIDLCQPSSWLKQHLYHRHTLPSRY